MDSTVDQIARSTKRIFAKYDRIKDKSRSELGKDEFWDLIVVTAADEAQKNAYEQQLKHKLDGHEIPSGLPYHVIADPPGPKIGGGGAFMHAVHVLNEMYGVKLKMWRILLINGGGMSQRLPNASALGKLFSPVPLERWVCFVLDLKLAMYLPFLPHMKPGYFHSACDDIVVYDFGDDCDLNFTRPGFTALAHKSSVTVAKSHGVYILEDKPADASEKAVETRKCIRVLQKPSEELMKNTGAILATDDDEPFVYTDSAFFLDHEVAYMLHQFYLAEKPLECELCPYGDFLQPLGLLSTSDYTQNTANVAKVEPKLVETREKLFNVLHDVPLNIIAMNISKFYHIGTIKEFLYHLCEDKILQKQLGLEKHSFSSITGKHSGSNVLQDGCNSALHGVVMHSSLAEGSSSQPTSVVEYCNFQSPVKVGFNSIISHCECVSKDRVLEIPDSVFLHTIPILKDGATLYVTVIFGSFDDIKKKLPPSLCGQLVCFHGYDANLEKVAQTLQLDLQKVFGTNSDPCSPWYARLFPARPTMTESFLTTLSFLRCMGHPVDQCDHKLTENESLYSMHDVLQIKDVKSMLAFRERNSSSQTIL